MRCDIIRKPSPTMLDCEQVFLEKESTCNRNQQNSQKKCKTKNICLFVDEERPKYAALEASNGFQIRSPVPFRAPSTSTNRSVPSPPSSSEMRSRPIYSPFYSLDDHNSELIMMDELSNMQLRQSVTADNQSPTPISNLFNGVIVLENESPTSDIESELNDNRSLSPMSTLGSLLNENSSTPSKSLIPPSAPISQNRYIKNIRRSNSVRKSQGRSLIRSLSEPFHKGTASSTIHSTTTYSQPDVINNELSTPQKKYRSFGDWFDSKPAPEESIIKLRNQCLKSCSSIISTSHKSNMFEL